jgi:hypothetical protein
MSRSKAVPSPEAQLQLLHSYGVEFRAEGTGWFVQKGSCVARLEKGSNGLRLTSPPGYQLSAEIGQLLDGGYQKFLVTPTRKLPATAEHLREMHAFQEALGSALGGDSLYNLSLGTVSTTYHYDRVKGRANP